MSDSAIRGEGLGPRKHPGPPPTAGAFASLSRRSRAVALRLFVLVSLASACNTEDSPSSSDASLLDAAPNARDAATTSDASLRGDGGNPRDASLSGQDASTVNDASSPHDSADARAPADDASTVNVPPRPCKIKAPTACPTPTPHYADIEPILQKRCVGCHFGLPDGPWPLTGYSHVVDWYDIIRAAMLNCTMPPADSGLTMTDGERVKILEWLRCGFPE